MEKVSKIWGTCQIKKSVGRDLEFFVQKYEDNSCQYLIKRSDWKKVSAPFAEKVLQNMDFLNSIIEKLKELMDDLFVYSKKVNQMDLKYLPNNGLYQLYEKFNQLNKKVYEFGLSIVLLDFQDTTYISDALSKYLKDSVNQKEYSDYFSVLTTAPKRTATREEEIDLFNIITLIKQNKRLTSLFLNKSQKEIMASLPKLYKNIYKKISEHIKKFAYVIYVYEGPALTYSDLILTIKDILTRKIKTENKIREIKKSEKNLVNKQKKYLQRLQPNKYHRDLILLAQNVSFIKYWRREQQSYCYYLIEPLLKVMARRLNISLKQLRFMLTGELEASLGKGQIDLGKINKRMKLCALACESGKSVKLLEGKTAEAFVKNIKKEIINFSAREFMGQTACPGKVKGKVIIVNTPDDMAKMNNGDVLVSFATNPNLMPAIRKASAIITDEGGLTCHAAIVSRELNIPCIVGLKVITKILKDGDLVEVDADRGVVKKI